MPNNAWENIKADAASIFNFSNYLVSQQEAEVNIREGISFRGTNLLILIFAILIASLGLNTNSTAVIIGAMLISPLMGPIIGIGLGIGIQDFDLLKRSMRNLVMAAGFSVLASTLYFLVSPVSESHSELLARTSPTIYDVMIGFFGGGAGIIAIGSRSKGNVIPGVAIATALMPPLCTVGYGLATLQSTYFFGALYLFLINSIFIALSTFIGVKLMRYKPVAVSDPMRARKVRRVVYILAVLTLLPSVYLTYNMLRQSRFDINVERFIDQECRWPDTHVLNSTTNWSHQGSSITLTLIGAPMPADSLHLALSSQLHHYGLQGSTLTIVQGNAPTLGGNDLIASSVRDIYEITQASLSAKQNTIDSLRGILARARAADTIATGIGPELRVVFPQVRDIAVTRAIFGNVTDNSLDTVNLALVSYRQAITTQQRNELLRYLQARLASPKLRLVDVSHSM